MCPTILVHHRASQWTMGHSHPVHLVYLQSLARIQKQFGTHRRKMLRSMSVKRRELNDEYRKIKHWWEPLHPLCCVPGCTQKRKDIHHRNGRQGILLVIHELWLPLCRPHHDRLKMPGGVAWGRSLDLLPPAGGHNTIPPGLTEKYKERLGGRFTGSPRRSPFYRSADL